MEHVRVTLLVGDPARIDDVARFAETKVPARLDREPGSRGQSVAVHEQWGILVLTSFWVSGDAMREAEGLEEPLRKEAAGLADATVTVEHYEVDVFTRMQRPHPGAGVRLTRMDVDPDGVPDAVAAYQDAALPWLTETDGLCTALLFSHPTTGRVITETVWRDAERMAASRSSAAMVRLDAVAAMGATLRSLEELRLQSSTALPD